MEYFVDYLEEKYIKYRKSLVPNCKPLLGVSTGNIKMIAKKLVLANDLSFFDKKSKYHEEDLLKAYAIGYLKDYEQMLFHLNHFIPQIKNWETCDYLVGNLSLTKKNLDRMLKFLSRKSLLHKEFTCRFVYVMLKTYYVKEEYLPVIFDFLNKVIDLSFYYAKMAKAWLLCECATKYYQETYNYLLANELDEWSFNKGITKMLESFRISQEEKEMLRKLKEKNNALR